MPAAGRVADVAIEDAGEWARRPGHLVWIGLYEPTADLLGQVQAQVRPAPARHRGRAARAPTAEARTLRRLPVRGRPHRAARGWPHRARRDTPVHRPRLRRD